MIRVQLTKEVDYDDIIRRSPVAFEPQAIDKLRQFVARSAYTYVGYIGASAACVYGMIAPTLLSDHAYLWMLTTDTAEENKFLFIRHSQLAVEELLANFTQVNGHCMQADTRAQRWLRWLGAEFLHPEDNKTIPFFITKDKFRARHG